MFTSFPLKCGGKDPHILRNPTASKGSLFPPSPSEAVPPLPTGWVEGTHLWVGLEWRETVPPSALTAPFPAIPTEPTCSCNSRLGCHPPPCPSPYSLEGLSVPGASPSFQGAGGHENLRPGGEHGVTRSLSQGEAQHGGPHLGPSHHFSIPVPLSSLPPSCCPLTWRGQQGLEQAPWPVLAPGELVLGP